MSARCQDGKRHQIIHDADRGEEYCARCGMVITDRMDDDSTYDMSGVDVRMSMSTSVGHPCTRPDAKMSALRMHDRRIASDAVPGSIGNAMMYRMRTIHDKLGTPKSVLGRSVEIYVYIVRGGMRGRRLRDVMAASTYVACREAGIPRTLHDIAGATGLTPKVIGRGVRSILEGGRIRPKPYNIPLLISRAVNTVGAGSVCHRMANDISRRLPGTYVDGKNPLVMAAAILYVATRRTSQKHAAESIAGVFGVTGTGVRMRAREIEAILAG